MSIRLNKVIRELNVGIDTVVNCLRAEGYEVNASPTEKISDEQYDILKKKFGADQNLRKEADKLISVHQTAKEKKVVQPKQPKAQLYKTEIPDSMRPGIKTVGKIDISASATKPAETPVQEEVKTVPTKKVETPQPVTAVEQKPAAEAVQEKPVPETPVAPKEEPKAVPEPEKETVKAETQKEAKPEVEVNAAETQEAVKNVTEEKAEAEDNVDNAPKKKPEAQIGKIDEDGI